MRPQLSQRVVAQVEVLEAVRLGFEGVAREGRLRGGGEIFMWGVVRV